MAEEDEGDDGDEDELPSVDHGPLNEGLWGKGWFGGFHNDGLGTTYWMFSWDWMVELN